MLQNAVYEGTFFSPFLKISLEWESSSLIGCNCYNILNPLRVVIVCLCSHFPNWMEKFRPLIKHNLVEMGPAYSWAALMCDLRND